MTTAATVSEVRRRFGRTQALSGATFEIGTGVTGLLGPNGAGKTTLLRILATVAAPDSGSVSVFGRDPSVASQRVEIRRRLGYLPQEPGFQRGFSVFEFIDYVAILKEMTNRQQRHAEVRRVIDAVDLASVSGKRVRSLSGGMRRRVALGASLLGEPQFLVLDEPTAGLDPEQRLRFRELVSRAGESRAVLLSTHQTEDVAALCQDVVVLDKGRVLFQGAPSELSGVAGGRVWLADERVAGAELVWRTGEGRFRHLGAPPSGAELVEPTLEDGYLLLVGRFDEEVAA
ncbi:MAG: ATP-binding cassette domain-containing protein [Actinomycetia bacterium]|nr:ATP-binding cassette domain-containing protein [Actinomycetes bacterium]